MTSARLKLTIDRLLDEAVDLAASGDWTAVRERAERVLRLDPENADARGFLEAANRDAGTPVAPVTPPSAAGAPATAAPATAASFANGRYAVKKFLGEGGKKKVFLAHDTVLDRDVAFALIKTEGLDDVSRQRITREAQAMGRLGDHPNIVPIFDLGIEPSPNPSPGAGEGGRRPGEGQPYMVLPLMSGGDVEGLIEKAAAGRPERSEGPSKPALRQAQGSGGKNDAPPPAGQGERGQRIVGLPLDRVLEIATDTCNGLVFAHSKGIVHRDLKPGNVWLTAEGTARIGDFGLAVATDRSRLTREGFMVGTVAYMPPEQAMGGEITPKADLYSLGAMLYEMVTGRPPFMGDDDIAIIGQHINTPPVAPAWHRADCPKPLDALIMRLLAKDPAQRPETAADVLSALKAIDPSPRSDRGEGGGTPGEGAETGRSLDSMSSGVFVGRHKEMDQLKAALEQTLSGHGRMVTLVGEPGIGKTRTSQELATYAGLRRCQVLWGRCYDGGGAPPYWPWVQAIRQYVREKETDQLRREMAASAAVISEVVTDVRERLPGVPTPPPIDDPNSARFRLFDSITSFLRTAAANQPIMLVLDDLHWSDKPSLLLLEFVARELGNSRVLLVGTYRDVDLHRRHPLAITLGDLTKERLFDRVVLRGLQKSDIEKFIELAAGVRPQAGLVDAVFTQTEGNPLFVTEVVRLLVQEGEIGGKSAGRGKTTTWIVKVPEGVREVIGRRLDRLSERCNEVLTVASVIGRQFSLSQLMAVLNFAGDGSNGAPVGDRVTEDRLLELVEEALGARIIEELPGTVGRYQFSHALIEETLSRELSTTRKVRLHARIAEAFERLYENDLSEHAPELVKHFAEAEAMLGGARLARYAALAGHRASKNLAFEEALGYYNRTLQARRDDPVDAEVAGVLAGAARAEIGAAGDNDAQQRGLNRALRAFKFFRDAGEADRALDIACIPFRWVQHEACLELTREALNLPVRESGKTSFLLSRSALQSADSGMVAEARVAAERAIEMATRLEAPNSLGWALYRKGMALASFDSVAEIVEAIELEKRAIGLATRTEDQLLELLSRYILAGFLKATGSAADAMREVEQALRIARALRDQSRITQASWVQSDLLLLRGDWEAALALERDFLGTPDASRRVAAEIGGNFSVTSAVEAFHREPLASVNWFRLKFVHRLAMDCHRAGTWPDLDFEAFLAGAPTGLIDSMSLAVTRGIVSMRSNDLRAAAEAVQKINEGAQGVVCIEATIIPVFAGELLVFLREHDRAIEQLKRGHEVCLQAKWTPSLARAKFWWSEALYGRGNREDAPVAAKLQEESLSIAQQFGMKPLVERIVARRKILKA